MTERPNATRIGLFALGGLALLAAAVVLVFGGRLWARSEQAVLQFRGSVYGLQVGSPVVFRGVRMGGVRSVGVAYGDGRFAVPVVIELNRAGIRTLDGSQAATDPALALAALVEQGLTAQLATHSLLTGQLYIDLDLRAGGKPARRNANGLLEIPTAPNRFQSLQDQLDRVDVARMADDIGATLAAARGLLGGPELKQTLADMAQASAALAKLSATLTQRLGPLADAAQGTLVQAGQASQRVAAAADKVGDRVGGAAERVAHSVAAAASRADALMAPDSPLLAAVQKAADELGRSAAALRAAASDESATVQGVQRAVGDVSRSARAVRELAEQLSQQPQSLLRGRADPP